MFFILFCTFSEENVSIIILVGYQFYYIFQIWQNLLSSSKYPFGLKLPIPRDRKLITIKNKNQMGNMFLNKTRNINLLYFYTMSIWRVSLFPFIFIYYLNSAIIFYGKSKYTSFLNFKFLSIFSFSSLKLQKVYFKLLIFRVFNLFVLYPFLSIGYCYTRIFFKFKTQHLHIILFIHETFLYLGQQKERNKVGKVVNWGFRTITLLFPWVYLNLQV